MELSKKYINHFRNYVTHIISCGNTFVIENKTDNNH